MKLLICISIFFGILSVTDSAKRSRRLLQNPGIHSSTCGPPLWNLRTADNWPLAGVLNTTKARFVIRVKGLDSEGRYKPGRKHTVVVRMRNKKNKKSTRITGFYVTITRAEAIAEECGGLGRFRASKAKGLKSAAPPGDCAQPLILDIGLSEVNSGSGKWIAPTCGDVILTAQVRGSDRRLYKDAEDVEEIYQTLTKRLSPSSH